VREVAGVGLRDELALLPPPRKGATVLTQPHCLRARGEQTTIVSWAVHAQWQSLCAVCAGICHLVVGSTYRPLELACLQALEHARGVQSKQLVCVCVCVCVLAGAYAMKTQCHVCTCRCLLDSCAIKPKS